MTSEPFHDLGEELTEVVKKSVLVDVPSRGAVCSRSLIDFWFLFHLGVLEGNGRDGTAWDNCSR